MKTPVPQESAPSNPTEGRSQVGEEAPSRVSPHREGIPLFPNLGAGDVSRALTSLERRDRPPQDQGQTRSHGQGSPDFGGGVGYHDDGMYRGGPIPENARSPTRAMLTPKIPPKDSVPKGCSLRSLEPLREWFCRPDMTSPAECEAALRVDAIQRGEALAIFERDLIIRFQQTSRAAALYIRALLVGVRELLRSIERLMRLPRTTRGQPRLQKRYGIHMRRVFEW